MGQLFRLKKKHLPVKKAHGETAKKLDHLMYGIALIAPIMTIPQVNEVWIHKSVQGVSVLTWGSYAFVSALWLIYGAVHKEKPIVLTHSLLLTLNTCIVIGVLLFR